MKERIRKVLSQSILLLIAATSLLACSTNGDSFPRIAAPPAFDYINGEELRSRMHQLAFEVQQLDLSLANEYDDRPDFQRDVVRSLQNIERIAGLLQSGEIPANHPFLRDDMRRFLGDVRKARTDASMGSPRYFMAGRILGACVNCHQQNR